MAMNDEMTLAETACAHNGFDFAETFRHQYLLTPQTGVAPSGFETRRFGDWALHHAPDLHLCKLQDRNGNVVGYVVGHAVDATGRYLQGVHEFPHAQDDPALTDHIDDFLTWCGGRFAAFVATPEMARAYADPVASFGFVYDPEARRLASSLFLALNRPLRENPHFDNAAIVGGETVLPGETAGEIPAGYSGGYGFGQTRDADVTRITGNHYLDLNRFVPVRHWPKPGFVAGNAEDDRQDLVNTIIRRITRVSRALIQAQPVQFSLSGGYDSRIVLACAADVIDEHSGAELFTFASTWNQTLDVAVSQALADKLNKPLRVVVPDDGHQGSFVSAEEQRRRVRQYILATGSIGPMSHTLAKGFLEQLPRGGLMLTGNLLEIASAEWWPGRKVEDPVDHALTRCGVACNTAKEIEDRRARFARWQQALPEALQDRLHDMTYWEGTLPYTQAAFMGTPWQFRVPPANDRAVLQAALQARVRWRKRRGLYAALIQNARPELATVPTVRELKARAKAEQKPAVQVLTGT